MSCFWQGILARLTPAERERMGPTPARLKEWLRANNRPSHRCLWQGELRSEAEIREAEEWIRTDESRVQDGHDTSTCDPYLCLLVELLAVDVVHAYMGTEIRYTFARGNPAVQVRTLRFRSDRGHFWAG